MCIDLHIHSCYSDGTASPEEIVRTAVAYGLHAIALTDHDTVEGIGEFLAQGCDREIQLFSGLEISAIHREYSLHILGYGIDHTSRNLISWLGKLQEGRSSRNREIIRKLQKMGHDIRAEELDAVSQYGQTGRPHIARLLRNKGIVKSSSDAFNLYLRKDGPAWADRFAYSAAESIEMIHRAGGIAVLAHPGILQQQVSALPLLIVELVERGLDGIEVFYPSHSPEFEKKLCSLARKYQLVLTGGSDYHGKDRAYSTLAGANGGFCPPASLLEPLHHRLRQRQYH